MFMEAVQRYGWKDVKSIAQHVGTRTPTQVRTHAQKLFLRQQKESTGMMAPSKSGRSDLPAGMPIPEGYALQAGSSSTDHLQVRRAPRLLRGPPRSPAAPLARPPLAHAGIDRPRRARQRSFSWQSACAICPPHGRCGARQRLPVPCHASHRARGNAHERTLSRRAA